MRTGPDPFRFFSFSPLAFSCAGEPGKALCEDLRGECVLQQDGYYFVSSICVLVGGLLLVFYIAPTIRYLESLSPKKWKLEQK